VDAQWGDGTHQTPQHQQQYQQWPPQPPGVWPGGPPARVGGLGTWIAGLLGASAALHIAIGALWLLGAETAAEVTLDVSSLFFLATVVLFLVWLYRARSNIEHLDPYQWAGHRRLSKGWAIGAWFVPIGFLWLPLQVVLDVWWGTREPPQDPRERRRTPKLITAWWTCWLLAWFTGVRLVSSVTEHDGGRSEFHSVTFFLGNTSLSALFTAAAAVLLMTLVRRISKEQTRRLGF